MNMSLNKEIQLAEEKKEICHGLDLSDPLYRNHGWSDFRKNSKTHKFVKQLERAKDLEREYLNGGMR